MTDTRPHFDAATEEQASLYVLELLPADTHREFDERLAADPALRELVRDLQGNLDALVFSDPPRPAPLSVWGRIAAEVKQPEAKVLVFPSWAVTWATRALAAAACVAFGALLHAWRIKPASVEHELTRATQATPLPKPVASTEANTPPGPVVNPAPAPAVTVVPTNLIAAAIEANVLRERVRMLAAQVTALNQVLTQQATLPSGATRMHVFQLVNTNRPGAMNRLQSFEDGSQLPDLLAKASADQMAATNAPRTGSENNPASVATATSTPVVTTVVSTASGTPAGQSALTASPPTATDPETPITVASATDTASSVVQPDGVTSGVVLDSASFNSFSLIGGGLSFIGTEGIGFISPDDDRGSIALSTDKPLNQNEDYQVWITTTGPGGARAYQSVGVAHAEGSVVVLKFQLPADAPPNPGLMVTREPSGGSTAPTGPVVVGAP